MRFQSIANILICAALMAFTQCTLGKPKDGPADPVSNKVQLLQDQVNLLKQSLEKMQADQTNYRIKKDLLKEAYSSNLQTINLVITLVLAVFGVIGFAGIRDINAIKKEYKDELHKLETLRTDFDAKTKQILDQQKTSAEVVSKLEHNVQLLEVQEKAGMFFQQQNYPRALQYIDTGLDAAPDDSLLNLMRANVLWRMNQLDASIAQFKKAIERSPEGISPALDMAEMLLISRRLAEFDEHIKEYRERFAQREQGMLNTYFVAIRAYVSPNHADFRPWLAQHLPNLPVGQQRRLGNWNFADIRLFLAREPQSPEQQVFAALINWFEGLIDTNALKTVATTIGVNVG